MKEKWGGLRHLDPISNSFNETINKLRLIHVETNNGIYTWNNKKGRWHQVAYRLDIFLIFEELMLQDLFMESTIVPLMGLYH